MSADIIQVKYDESEAIARRFGQSAQAQVALEQRMRRSVQRLQDGGWEGRGSAAFYAEMSEKVFPAMQRLVDALRQAQKVTLQISQALQAAEADAARPFRSEALAVEDSHPVSKSSPFQRRLISWTTTPLVRLLVLKNRAWLIGCLTLNCRGGWMSVSV